jgi:hypothetical protein
MSEMRNSYNILTRKHKWNAPEGRNKSLQEDNIKINLNEIVCDNMN